MMDFSGTAGAGSDFDLLPKGLIVWAYLALRGVKGSGSGGGYLDCELTVAEGQPYAGRKLWEMIGDPFNQGNSEKYRKMGMVAITRILEAGRGAGPNNPAGYQLAEYPGGFQALDGLKVAIKVGIENGTDGHDDKNRVAEWLTPNPASQSGYKGFAKLLAGDHGLAQQPGGGAGNGNSGGFGGATAPATHGSSGGFGQSQTGGFGQGGGGNAGGFGQSQGSGSGNGSGFGKPPADSSGQSGAEGAGPASQTTSTTTAPSDPGQTPGWLSQAGPQTQG